MSRKAAIWIGAGALLWYGVIRGVRAAKITFDKLRVVGVTPASILYRVTCLVHNPLWVNILVNDVQGKVYVMNTHVATVNYPINQLIRSFAMTAFDIEFEAYSSELGAALWENIQTGDPRTLTVTFDGYIEIKGVKIPLSKQWTYDEIFTQA